MKSEEQIKNKVEQLKTDLNGKFASNHEENLHYSIVLKTLTWVLENKEVSLIFSKFSIYGLGILF